MNFTTATRSGRVLNVAFDVSSETLNWSMEVADSRLDDKMPGEKAITCVMRKILKMFFGWYRSGCDFDQQRVFTMASEYKKAA